MTIIAKLNIHSNYRFCAVVFTAVYLLLTFACSVQKETDSAAKSESVTIAPDAVNINSATAEELEKIPYIGKKLAGDIIAYRETHGSFRKPEHLMLIQGISDKRFREIRHLLRTE
ncbi:MAG: helix-hairpin-helix domain-containing protein [Saprospiraceae bacterium]|nr:helix-hairpin-helix domain-containing protein [Pyrinomonadaceae bacterium]